MEEYGVDGRVGWVYRQFPLVGLHPNAAQIAETALCVGHVGGRKAFWDFTDLVYNDRQATEFTNVTKIPQYIEKAGVSLQEHEACLVNEVMKEHLENEMADALDAGIEGTPYTFIMVGDEQAVINGAQSYQVVKSTIQNLIDQLDGEFDIDTASTSNVIPTNELGIPEIE
jgi:protein-disulfide isomerase